MNADELRERRKYIGASEMAAVLGVDLHGKTAAQVWLSKIDDTDPEDENSPASLRGTFLEDAVARMYDHVQGTKLVRIEPRVHPTIPFIRASGDRAVLNADGSINRGVEIKTMSPALKTADGERVIDTYGDEGSDQIPFAHIVQSHVGMMAYGVDTWDAPVLFGGYDFSVKFFRVRRDDRLVKIIEDKAAKFWRLVESRCPPEGADWEDRSAIVKQLHPKSDGNLLRVDPSDEGLITILAGLKAAEEAKDIAVERFNQFKVLTQEAIGNADGLQLPEATVTWKSAKDSTKVLWEHACVELLAGKSEREKNDFLARFTENVPGSRRFLTNWTKGYETQKKVGGKKAAKELS